MSKVSRTREFPVRDILTAVSGRLLTRPAGPRDNGIGNLYKFLEYLTGEAPFTNQLGRFGHECRRYILDQHPVFGSAEMDLALGELDEMLKSPEAPSLADRVATAALIDGWLIRTVYPLVGAELLPLCPIPRDDHTSRDPVEELRELCPTMEIIQIEWVEQ